MAIKMRRGQAKDYDPSALVSGEIALIKDEKKMKVAFDDGETKEVLFKEDTEFLDGEIDNRIAENTDTELNEESDNPVSNSAATHGIGIVAAAVDGLAGTVGTLSETVERQGETVARQGEILADQGETIANQGNSIRTLDNNIDEVAAAVFDANADISSDREDSVARDLGLADAVSLDTEVTQAKVFENIECTLELAEGFKDKCMYALCFPNASYLQSLPEMYTNMGILCALTDTTTATAQRFNSSVSADRRTINSNLGGRRNALWIAESNNGSTTEFHLKNAQNNKYLRNNNGAIDYRDNSGSTTIWTLKNVVAEGFIFKALVPTSDTTKYIRVSNGSNVFKFGSTATESDGRNANLLLYKVSASTGDTYTVDFTNEQAVSGNSQRSIDEDGHLVIVSAGAGQDTVFKPSINEVGKFYTKCTINYTKASGGGTFAYKYHKLGAGTRPQDDYKWGTGDEFKFPSSSSVREITFDTAYTPVDEVVIFDWNEAGRIVINSVVFSEPKDVTHDYMTDPVITAECATGIKVAADGTIGTVYATNNAGASSPTWEDITSAVKNKTVHTFANAPTTGLGVAVRHVTESECNILAWRAEYPDESGSGEVFPTTEEVQVGALEDGTPVYKRTFFNNNISLISDTLDTAHAKIGTISSSAIIISAEGCIRFGAPGAYDFNLMINNVSTSPNGDVNIYIDDVTRMASDPDTSYVNAVLNLTYYYAD